MHCVCLATACTLSSFAVEVAWQQRKRSGTESIRSHNAIQHTRLPIGQDRRIDPLPGIISHLQAKDDGLLAARIGMHECCRDGLNFVCRAGYMQVRR